MNHHAWKDDAACLNRDPSWWDYDTGPTTAQNNKAIAICNRCPVRTECLTDAMDNKAEHGIWGGLTPLDRKYLAKELERKRSSKALTKAYARATA
jgi:WhiB family redox-sensing transcriptional regulator